jgi:phosphoribosyl 1,2-cyclic phosphate phosphodiesterase
MIENGAHTFVVDAGPDFRQQMLRNNVRKLDGLLITHEHKDHVAGLDDVRAFNYIQDKSMPVYALPRVLDHIKIEFAYAFAEKKYPGVPQIELIDIGHDPFSSDGFRVIPIPVMHAKLPILGFRFGDFTYITDCNYLSPESMELIRGSKVLVLNALQKTPHISHYTLDEAIAVANELEIPKVYFTHISHRMGLHKEVEKELPAHIRLANDGLTIEI